MPPGRPSRTWAALRPQPLGTRRASRRPARPPALRPRWSRAGRRAPSNPRWRSEPAGHSPAAARGSRPLRRPRPLRRSRSSFEAASAAASVPVLWPEDEFLGQIVGRDLCRLAVTNGRLGSVWALFGPVWALRGPGGLGAHAVRTAAGLAASPEVAPAFLLQPALHHRLWRTRRRQRRVRGGSAADRSSGCPSSSSSFFLCFFLFFSSGAAPPPATAAPLLRRGGRWVPGHQRAGRIHVPRFDRSGSPRGVRIRWSRRRRTWAAS